MRITEMSHSAYQSMTFTDQTLIRAFFRWRAFRAVNTNGHLVIILEEYVRRKVTLCEYRSTHEWNRDIQVLRDISEGPLPPKNGGGTPTPASVVQAIPFPLPVGHEDNTWSGKIRH